MIFKSSEKLRSVARNYWPHFEVVRIHPTSRCELFMFAARLGSTKSGMWGAAKRLGRHSSTGWILQSANRKIENS